MKDVGSWALGNRTLVWFLTIVLVAGGIVAYRSMSKMEDPEIKVKTATILTLYPGASAHQVELEVTDKLEKSIRSMKNVGNISSRSMNDASLISVELSTLVPDTDVEQPSVVLQLEVARVHNDLTESIQASIVMDDYGDVYGMMYALSYEGYENNEAVSYAELIKKEIPKIAGIS